MSENSNPAHESRRPRIAVMWILGLLVVAAIFVLNLGRLKAVWNTGADVLRLRKSVQQEFDVEDVSINLQLDAAGNMLSIELRNPPFEELADAELEAKAKQIARLAYREFGEQHDYEQVSVVLVDKPDGVITMAEKREFKFTAEELSAPAEPAAPKVES